MAKLRTRARIATLGSPLDVCPEHLERGYGFRQTVSALARHVSIQPTLPVNRCQIRTHAGVCNQPARWRLTYWQALETVREPEPKTLQESIFDD